MCNVRDFGAAGDGVTDDYAAIMHAIEIGEGRLEFPTGNYRISKTLEINLDKISPSGISGADGTARIIMAGQGPAFRFTGTHTGTGDPNSVTESVRTKQRFPTVSMLEITGDHPEADGIELIGTMQAVIQNVLIQKVRHGIRLHRRNRNVIISDSHIYFNTGIGIHLDDVNLHQINIIGNHISYNRIGGIKIERSEVRNLQITGNDIEYNNHRAHKTEPEPTAEIYIDTTAPKASVAEVTITSNTIQATDSPGGANIHIRGNPEQAERPGLWTIASNVIGSQENNMILVGCHSLTISGNTIYSAVERNLVAEQCTQLILSGNDFRRHTPTKCTGLKFTDCQDCTISGCSIKDEAPDGQVAGTLVVLEKCRRMIFSSCQILDGVPYGIELKDCQEITLANCHIQDTRPEIKSSAAVFNTGENSRNLISNCRLRPYNNEQIKDSPQTIYQGNLIE